MLIQTRPRFVYSVSLWGAEKVSAAVGLRRAAIGELAGPYPREGTIPNERETVTPNADAEFAELVRAIAERGDRGAFAHLFAHFAPRVKAYLQRGGTSPSAAEELVQEVMLTVWRRSSLFDPVKAGVGTWIFTIARNKRVDRFRRENRGPLDPDDPMLHGEPDVPAVQAIETAEEARSLRAAIAELPPEQASIVRLHYFASKAHSEIARDLDLPIGTVKSRLRLAIGRLRKALGNTAA